jgi:hypothetical protein
VVNDVTGASESERKAATDGSQPQEVTPPSDDGASQPQGDSGGQQNQPQPSGAASSQDSAEPASSGGNGPTRQGAAPSGPRRASRPGVASGGQAPASNDDFESIDRGAYQPREPQVLGESSGSDSRDVAALPSLPVLDEASATVQAQVPNRLVAAAAALVVMLAAAHSLHATRRLGAAPNTDE